MPDRSIQDMMKSVAGAAMRAGRGIDVSLAAFVVSACTLSFAYGVAVMTFQLFPYTVLSRASVAFDAWRALEDDALMFGAMPSADAAPAPLVATVSGESGAENVLIAGGPYQFMERCPAHGCLAWVIDRNGDVLHSWEVDVGGLVARMGDAFSGGLEPASIYPVGMALADDGSLYATFQGRNIYPYQIGIAKIAPDGDIAWMKVDHSHHWPALGRDGLVYTPSMVLRENLELFEDTVIATRCWDGPLYGDGVRVYTPEGELHQDYRLLRSIAASDLRGLLYSSRSSCDPLHINSVDVATPEAASRVEGLRAGDLLVSIRELSAIVTLDRDTGEIKHHLSGRTAAQHAATFLPDGRVLAFDNQGGEPEMGGSRIVRIDLDTASVETLFPKPGQDELVPFHAERWGCIDVSPDGRRALISSGETGHVFELDLETGDVLWVSLKMFDIDGYARMKGVRTEFESAHFRALGGYYVSDAALAALQGRVLATYEG